jgi:hypothetical protein
MMLRRQSTAVAGVPTQAVERFLGADTTAGGTPEMVDSIFTENALASAI